MANSNKYNYLFDIVSSTSNNNLEIISESRSEETGEPKVVFKAKLQTADEKNQNGRIYSMGVCQSITNQLKDKALNRSLLMEVDQLCSL